MQKIIVTTCPWFNNKSNKWMLSAYFSFQLQAFGTKTLKDYPDVLNWMSKIENALFYSQINNETPIEIKPISTKWNKELYSKLFNDNILVKGFAPLDISKLSIKSYPNLHLTNFILETYKDVGNLKTDTLPDTNFFVKQFTKLKDLGSVKLSQNTPLTSTNRTAAISDFLSNNNELVSAARSLTKQVKVIPFSNQPNTKQDIGQFKNFHAKIDDKIAQKIPDKIKLPEFEYHEILSLVSSYPVITRMLGIVIDFELPAKPGTSNGTIRIIPANLNFDNEIKISSPSTAFTITKNGFFASAKPESMIDKGFLKLNTNDFSVSQIDTDSAALKLANQNDNIVFAQANNLVNKSNIIQTIADIQKNQNTDSAKPNDNEETNNEGLPTLRSAGIALIKNGLAEIVFKKLNRNFSIHKEITNPSLALNSNTLQIQTPVGVNNKPNNAIRKQITSSFSNINIPFINEVLFADDLVMGYKLDVAYESKPNKWYSLHKRKNTYSFVPFDGNEQKITVQPEDEIDEGYISLNLSRDVNDDGEEDKMTEVLARWEGWSLSIPRPGKTIDGEGKGLETDAEEKKKYKLNNQIPFRLQVNSVAAPKSLPALRFGTNYRLRVRTVDIAGNSLDLDTAMDNEALYIKSGIKYLRYEPIPVPHLVQEDEVATGDKSKMRDRDGESIEHMVIRSNYDIDTQTFEKNNPTNIYEQNIANTKPAKILTTLTYQPVAVRHFLAPKASQQICETHGVFDAKIKDANGANEMYDFINTRDIAVKENDAKRKDDLVPFNTTNVPITYLADPMAAGIILSMKSETDFEINWKKGEVKKFSFYFNDQVNDTNADKPYDFESWKNPKSIKIKLIEGNADPLWNSDKRELTISLPKSADVTLYYASFWRPSDLDKFSGLFPILKKGNNSSRVIQTAKSGTHWMFSPWRKLRLVHAVQQPLQAPVMIASNSIAVRNYGDTHSFIYTKFDVHGSSTDKIDLTAQWFDWVDDLNEKAPRKIDMATHVNSVYVGYKQKQIVCGSLSQNIKGDSNIIDPIRHDFADTKHRIVNYKPSAASRYREYFTTIIETAKQNNKPFLISREGNTIQLNILSSAKPQLPVLEYVVPSFNWLKNKTGNVETHIRTSNIRVYLARPWYSSGNDEQIAVILPKNGMPVSAMKKYCTIWGKDPVYNNSAELNNSNFPQQEHFFNAEAYKKVGIADMPLAATYDTVYLAEESVQVNIAAFKVLFDEEKQMHYADIPVFIAFAYFPFIKLSLARYQKNSLRTGNTDCCLSNIVQSDWIQIAPTRATSIMPVKGQQSFNVVLRGTAPFNLENPSIAAMKENKTGIVIEVSVENATIPKTDEAFIKLNSRVQGIRTTEYIKKFNVKREQINNGQIDFTERLDINIQPPYRIVIKEYELHEKDPIRAQADAKARAFDPMQDTSGARDFVERLVFMDVYEVD